METMTAGEETAILDGEEAIPAVTAVESPVGRRRYFAAFVTTVVILLLVLALLQVAVASMLG